jgi:GDPmannose 4,6-dehydratase
LQKTLFLGNLEARRDWGFAGDYVEAMWAMLQRDVAEDFVIGTGESHSVREFVELAFSHAGLDWHDYVRTDPRYFRPAEVDFLQADTSKARQVLGWEPKVGFQELVKMMVDADTADLRRRLKGGTDALRNPAGVNA